MNLTLRTFERTNKAINFNLKEALEMIWFTFLIHYKEFLCRVPYR